MKIEKDLPPLLIVAGPTATGKSALAIEVAERLNGSLINADSMQVYQEVRILSARPGIEDETRVPHKLYGTLSAKRTCSAGVWRDMATQEIDRIWEEGRLPILVGGTGLYLKALMDGISEIPGISSGVKEEVRSFHIAKGLQRLRNQVEKVDPITTKRLSPGDTQRLIRAYEVFLETGISLSEWHNRGPKIPAIRADIQSLVLEPPREVLYAACDERFDRMLERGAIDEVRNIMKLELEEHSPILRILGVKDLISYLLGKTSLDTAKNNAKQATRNFAKRQVSWFRNQFGKSERIFAQYSESLFEEIFSKIRF